MKDTRNMGKETLRILVGAAMWIVSHFTERRDMKDTDGDKIFNSVLVICLNYLFIILIFFDKYFWKILLFPSCSGTH